MKRFTYIVVALMSVVGLCCNAYAYQSQAAPRPGTGVPSNAGPPVVCGGWDCFDDEPQEQYRYDTSRFTINPQTQYDYSVAEASDRIADWYLDYACPGYEAYNSSQVNAALNDSNTHRNYYKQCITYGLYQGRSTIASYYDRFHGEQLKEYLRMFMDGVMVGCYNRR